jgi:hypothetical protein
LHFGFTDSFPKASHAMRKIVRRRPEFEALESLRLLSGIAAAGSATAPGALQLSGSLRGITATKGSPTFNVSGALSPIGHVTAAGHGSIASVTSANGSYSLLTRLGRVFVGTDVASIGKRSFAGEYTIQGGTKSYAGATGSGHFRVSDSGSWFLATFS